MDFFRCFLVVLFFFINWISCDEIPPIVHTPLGSIEGLYAESYSGRKYKTFEGIPFAEPPVGSLRFEEPQPIKNWTNILSADKPIRGCIQYIPVLGNHKARLREDEDCLYLNIYVPNYNGNQLLPVLFFIPAGAFLFGKAMLRPKFIMDRNVIFVSHNYRLGIFGFLSTEDENIPGNMGLKDQSMALRWIFNNIKSFGGDPKRITLIGASSAAACVHFHYMSPLSRGLFQNGISFSSTTLAPGKLQKQSYEKFKKIAAILRCPTEDIPMTVSCLRSKPALEILKTTESFFAWLNYPYNPFGPVVEKGAKNPFIDRLPLDIINRGDVADALWITGVVEQEGCFSGQEMIDNDTYLEELNNHWNRTAPHLLMYDSSISTEKQNYLSEIIRKKYFKEDKITKENADVLTSLIGDRLYCSSARRAAKLQAKQNNNTVLFWFYSYRALTSLSNLLTREPANEGPCHTDDLLLLFGESLIYPPNKPEDRDAQIKLLDIIISIVAEGYPKISEDVIWERVNPEDDQLDMLHFASSTNISMESRTDFCEYQFWDEFDGLTN